MTRTISECFVDPFGGDWLSWIQGNGSARQVIADGLALRGGDSEKARAQIRRSVIALVDEAARGNTTLFQSVLVPDRMTGAIHATMDISVVGFPPGDEVSAKKFVSERDIRKVVGRRVRVTDYEIDTHGVEAGDAVIERMLLTPRRDRLEQGSVQCTLFPPDCVEAIALRFNTIELDLMDFLTAEALRIAQLTTVELAGEESAPT